MGGYANIISLVLIVGVFYFMIIRPQKKRQQSQKQMMENLKTGDKVVTIGGINGTIVAIDSETIIISTGSSDESTLVMSKVAVSQVVEESKVAIPEITEENNDDEYEEEYEDDDEDDDDEYEDDDEDDEEEDDEEDNNEAENKETSK